MKNNGNGNKTCMSKETTIFEEDVPVIVRRRGCLLRVRITSITDDDLEQYDKAYVGCIEFVYNFSYVMRKSVCY